MIAGTSVAGRASMPGTRTCALITEAAPAATAARNGTSHGLVAGSPRSTSGRSWWLSTPVSPWPGKCLAQARTPADWSPATQAAVCRATRAGSVPKLRTPMTGFAASTLTSASGA